MIIDLDYKNHVLQTCIHMADGQTLGLKKEHAKYAEFLEAIKIIIDWKQDRDHGFWLEFNNDYTKLIKRRL